MECVCISSFSLALNGSLHGFFFGEESLKARRPDVAGPLPSKYGVLFSTGQEETSTSDFNFHSKCDKLTITHFLFAEDLMLFSRGDLPSIYVLMECLQEFRDAHGLTVNTSKSCIFTASVRNEELDGILARTEFVRGEMPIRFLGIPLAAQRLSVTNYSPLVDQIANYISKWTAKSLLLQADWNLSVQLFRGWSAFGSKFSHFQRRLLRKFTGFARIFSGILGGHQSRGRTFAIPMKKEVLVFGTFSHGTLCSLPVSYGTSTARQNVVGAVGQWCLP
ncbi:UNVERIFIED_CONTAM: hypothetical protein Sindi_1460100 [Sesamum indicum]